MEAARMSRSRKISASSARAHTRKQKQGSSSSGIFKKVLVILFFGILAWGYQAIQPPPPKVPGAPGGPPVTAPRIKLRDGRHLAYQEYGVPKDMAKYKVIHVHGFDSCRYDAFVATSTEKLHQELGIYSVSFDRPGYGESDPDPKRTPKSIALDIEELADQLGLGRKFYVLGFSMGGEIIWTCLKYIPHRLSGAALLAPVVNYWWPGFPANVSAEAYKQQSKPDQWAVRVAHYTPWLTYWWNTQKWFPGSNVISHNPAILSPADRKILSKRVKTRDYLGIVKHQGEFESLHRDMIVGFGTWEFDPMDLENPFPNGEGVVHLWHGDEDYTVPVTLPRCIAKRLPWIKYHELPGTGHLFPLAEGMGERILKSLLVGADPE